jgi:putative ATPase
MFELNFGTDYKYAHDFPGHFVKQDYLPHELLKNRIWKGQESPSEKKLVEYIKAVWGERYS